VKVSVTYFDERFATVAYERDIDTVVASMGEFAEGEAFREYMNSIIDAIEAEHCDRVIADTSDMGALTEDDQAWSVTDWAPRAEDAGLDHMALVMPESIVAEMSVENVMEMADDDIERELFDDIDDARDWAASR
jgi:hypothetical protein